MSDNQKNSNSQATQEDQAQASADQTQASANQAQAGAKSTDAGSTDQASANSQASNNQQNSNSQNSNNQNSNNQNSNNQNSNNQNSNNQNSSQNSNHHNEGYFRQQTYADVYVRSPSGKVFFFDDEEQLISHLKTKPLTGWWANFWNHLLGIFDYKGFESRRDYWRFFFMAWIISFVISIIVAIIPIFVITSGVVDNFVQYSNSVNNGTEKFYLCLHGICQSSTGNFSADDMGLGDIIQTIIYNFRHANISGSSLFPILVLIEVVLVFASLVINFGFWFVTLSATTRRLHDAGFSGWWQVLMYLVPFFFIGTILWLVLCARRSNYIYNKYVYLDYLRKYKGF